jgi:rubredoxin
MLAECEDCGFVYDPNTGLVLEMGNPARVKDPFAIPTDE